MSASCSGNCDSCGESCSSRSPESLLAPANKLSNIKHVIAVVSGKGGVGKSTVTSMMAVAMNKIGYKTAILDADITGPSIPQAFGLHEPAVGSDDGILPAVTKDGIKIMSINLLLPKETDPVVWRGPVVAGAVKQLWTDVCWGDVDYMFVDLPPGTGDVPLTVFQSLPISGIVIVTTPQDLVGMIVAKAVNMADMMKVPVLGIVENMSYYKCPDCGSEHSIFGESKVEALAKQYNIPHFAKLPIDPVITTMVDAGEVESVSGEHIAPLMDSIEKEI